MLKKTGGHYPAPLEAIEVVKQGTATTLAEGLKLEAEAFGRLAAGDVSRNLVSVFFATQEIKKDAGYPEGTPRSRSPSSACSAPGSWAPASRARPRRPACRCASRTRRPRRSAAG